MSPTEFELRAALRDGEGDGVDADAVIGRALAVRRAHRVRALSIAAAVIVVGAVSAGAVAVTGNGHARTTADRAASGDSAVYDGSRGYASGSGGTGGGTGGTGGNAGGGAAGTAIPKEAGPQAPANAACPANPPTLLLPGGGGSGQFGSGDALFARSVADVVVCGYASGQSPQDRVAPVRKSTELTGAQASALAAEISRGSIRASALPCPTQRPGAPKVQLDLIAKDAQGRSMNPVVVTVFCANMATNGTAVRYGFTLNTVSGFIATLS